MQTYLHLLTLTLIAIVGFCFVGVQPFPVLHDFPEWMYQGWIAHQLWSGDDTGVSSLFAFADFPVPNSITQFSIATLNSAMSPIMAGKVWLAVYLVYASILWTVLSRQIANTGADAKRDDGAINLLLTMTITFGPGFWNGYANFQVALLFWGTYLLAMRLRRDGLLVHLLLSLLIFFSHAAIFIAFTVMVTARVLLGRLSWRYFAAIAPALFMFFWYLLATVRIDKVGPLNALGLLEWVQYKVYTVAKQGYFHNFIVADGSSLLDTVHPLYLFGVGLNLCVAVIIIIWFFYQGWTLFKATEVLSFNKWGMAAAKEEMGGNVDSYRVTFVALLTLLLLFLVAGKDNFGVVNLGERFLIAALVLALVQLRCHWLILRTWVVLAVIGALYTMAAVVKLSGHPVEEYAVTRSTTSSTLNGAIDDIYANSRHKLFNHRLFIYADHGIWLQQPGADLLPLKHITSFVVPNGQIADRSLSR